MKSATPDREYERGRRNPRSGLDVLVLSPAGTPDAAVAIAAARAGAIGALDLEFFDAAADEALTRLLELGHGRCAVMLDDASGLAAALVAAPPAGLHAVVLAGEVGPHLASLIAAAHAAGLTVFTVAVDVEAALAGAAAGADAVIAKGHEAGGWIGDDGCFVLMQACLAAVDVPVWAHGGVGLHTAAACRVAGAAGVVLDAQVLLARESPLGETARERLAAMDGSETIVLGRPGAARRLRVFSRPGLKPVEALRALENGDESEFAAAARTAVDWRDGPGDVLSVGQDAAFAADLARRFRTVGGIVTAIRQGAEDQVKAARERDILGEHSPLAASHGTRYPIAQGPMTRVSDRAAFAASVAAAGGLPFLALALMRGEEPAALLSECADLLGDRPWGVGILGFVPAEIRAEQLEAVRANRPPFALIAGGRPDQARVLEDEGIATYLHVPSPGLLRLYLKDGARRFVFEGRECGGHVGPRTSLVLWDTMVRVLLEELPAGGDGAHVLFAGGIHDAASAAMVAAVAAPLAEHGVRVGVLLGTAYVFTEEAVRCGAITPRFQQAAVEATRTVLLETGPGHATRCLPSPFVDEFHAEQRRLRLEAVGAEEERARLELLNIGRLRVAAKGVDRAAEARERRLVDVGAEEQWTRGMFMIGQVAALRDRVVTVAELHADVGEGARLHLEGIDVSLTAGEPAPPPADIAIVGIGCILPGASDAETFWSNVLLGVDSVTEIPPTRWDWRRYFDPDRATPDKVYSRWGGFVGDVPFDPVAFGMPPNSLRSIEPFQLLSLLAAKAALDDAGYGERPFARERTAVILGAGGGGADLAVGYTVRATLPSLVADPSGAFEAGIGGRLPEWTEDTFPGLLMNVAAGRIANYLDLGGPNFTVDAACGSSLAAIHLAARDLQGGTSDMAVAGGIDAIQNPFSYLCFAKTHALSPTGRCKPFSADADGIAISEGFAAVVLKRLEDAERDGDRIYAVIRGVGSASDGRDRSLTAPRPEGQERALRRAYAHAGISPATIGLVEAHGTGTVAGDQAEVAALTRVYNEAGAARQRTAIGSVKSMIGHTKATAGVAGLIKAALALHHRVLPPTLGVSAPNPKIDFPSSPFYVNTESRPWLRGAAAEPRRAAVSAFGFGGTDWHAVLEEYDGSHLPDGEVAMQVWPAELYLWRGETRAEVAAAVEQLAAALATAPVPPAAADLAFTLARAAEASEGAAIALAVVAESVAELQRRLPEVLALLAPDGPEHRAADGIFFAEAPLARDGSVAFLFPGQGSQQVGMARELAVLFPEMRESFERADAVLDGRHEQPLSAYIFPPPSFTADEQRARQTALTDTHVAQPALGATELGYLHLLRGLGIAPQLAAGHSYGEFVALAAAGVIGEDDLLRLSEARGRFIVEEASEDTGAMAAVDAGPDALAPLVAETDLVLANLNAPEQSVLSGSHEDIERALAWCKEHGVRAHPLPVACAFHSPLVAPAQRRLAEELRTTSLSPPRLPVFSNTTAGVHPDTPESIAALLAEHLTQPVVFSREVEAMYDAGARVFVEVGPRNVLTGLVGKTLGERPHLAVAVDQPGRPGLVSLLHSLAALAAAGVPVRPQRLFRGRSIRRLDPRTLAPVAGAAVPSSTTWFVNGGRARPANEPAVTVPDPLAVQLEDANMTDPVSPSTRVNDTGQRAREVPAPAAAPAANGDLAGDVMGRYQQVMQQFLDTQRSVMLAYLGRPDAAQAAPPAYAPAPVPLAGDNGSGDPPGNLLELTAGTGPAAPEAPRAPVPPAPAEVRSAATPGLDGDALRARLLEVVSDRTGYPPEMLELDADIEADLGIDSIKRVEIAGTIAQELTLPDGVELDAEEMTASRTLRQVLAVLERLGEPVPAAAGDERRPFESSPVDERIGRHVLRPVDAPAARADGGFADAGVVVISDDATGVAEALEARLNALGHRSLLVRGDEVAALDAPAKALVHLGALGPDGVAPADLLRLAQRLRTDLEAAAAAGGAAVLGATALGGAFGVDGLPEGARAEDAAVCGFLKTLALEWPEVRVTALDLGQAAPDTLAAQVAAELLAGDRLVEVGYRDNRRTVLELLPAPLADDSAGTTGLEADAVVLITGGARGITAEVAVALARRDGPRLLLAGRTAVGEPDPELDAIDDVRALRRRILERLGTGGQVTPAAVEEEVRRVTSSREVRRTLERIRAAGAEVEYLTCDVADAPAFGALIDDVYARFGRLDGVIHGAGVIEDRLVRDKDPASLERVLAVKAGAARTLAAHLRPEGLRFLVFFSSVSGRFGNRGQADYAAASEVLSKLAQDLDRRWPARVVAINWAPWSGTGMVSPELQRQFEARGVPLIDVATGCKALLDELRVSADGEAEVVIGAAPPAAMLAADGELTASGPGRLEVLRALDPERDRYLADHCLDGKPVLPFAAAMELMAETAAAARPALLHAEISEIRLFKGITVDGEVPRVRVVAEPLPELGVEVTIADAATGRPRYRSVVRPAMASMSSPEPLDGLEPFPMAMADAYRDLLFHGPLFQGIRQIDGMDERGASATLHGSAPTECLRHAGRAAWLLDPVLVDSALQVQVLWARLQWDVTLLPADIGAARFLASELAGRPAVRHELRIRPESRAPLCLADHWFLTGDGRVVGMLTAVQGVGTRALNRLAGAAQ